jgi:hypothetical protein
MKLNTWTGRALHGFNWLADEFIGALPASGTTSSASTSPTRTRSSSTSRSAFPSMAGYRTCEHSAEWWEYGTRSGEPRPC